MIFNLSLFKYVKSLFISSLMIFLLLLSGSSRLEAKPNMINTWPECPPQSNTIWVQLDPSHSPTGDLNVVQIPFDSGTITIDGYEYDNYVRGVLAGEVGSISLPEPTVFDNETLKAMTVAIRTKVYQLCGRDDYNNYFLDNNNILRRGVRGQDMQDYQYNKALNFTASEKQRYQDAVDDTDGLYLTYNNDTFDIFYRTIGGENTQNLNPDGPHKGIYDPAGKFHTEIDDDPGLAQINANHWATSENHGETLPQWNYLQILTHYYTGIHIRDNLNIPITPFHRWNPLTVDWNPDPNIISSSPPAMQSGVSTPVTIQLQNTGVDAYTSFDFRLSCQWRKPDNSIVNCADDVHPDTLNTGATNTVTLNVTPPSNFASDTYTLIIDMKVGDQFFHDREGVERPWFTLDYQVTVAKPDSGGPVHLPIIMKNYSPPVTCQQGGNLIQNAGFESSLGTYWVEVPQPPWNYTFRTYLRYKSGGYSVVLGGLDDADETLYQLITLPAGTVSAQVSFWLYMDTQESSSFEYDKLIWDLKHNDTGDSVLQKTIVNSNKSIDEHTWTKITADISGLEDDTQQPLRFNFRSITDGSNYTNFWIDDVEFIYTWCQ